MNARERVLAVLNRETPDRLPVDIWLVPELVEKFKQKLGVDDEMDVYRQLDIDKIAWVNVPFKGELSKISGQEQVNHWGVGFEMIEANNDVEYGEVSFNPLLELDEAEQLADYPWPNPDEFDYETAAAEAKKLSKEFVTLGPWRGFRYLRFIARCVRSKRR